jgi:hypothetical protein
MQRRPHWAERPELSAVRFAKKPQCSSSIQYSILELLLQGAERHHVSRAERAESTAAAAAAAEVPMTRAASSSSFPVPALDSQLGSSASQTPSQASQPSPLGWSVVAELELEEVPQALLHRNDSEWSLLSFSSLQTVASIELSEAQETSEDDRPPSVRSNRARRGIINSYFD